MNPLFTKQEYQELIRVATGETGATQEQVFWFIRQCEELRASALTLELILSNLIEVKDITEHDFKLRRK